jgi:hypothetical protein
MSKILIIFFFLFYYANSFADVGNAWRYNVKIHLKKDSLTGYIYFYTYESSFDASKEQFTDYIKNHYPFPLNLYSEIKTVQLGEDFEADFFISNNKQEIKKEDIDEIELLEEVKFPVGSRLHELTIETYDLLDEKPIETAHIYDNWMENCTLIFMNWSTSEKLSEVKIKIENELDSFLAKGEENKIYSYLKKITADLSKREILLFNHCDAL